MKSKKIRCIIDIERDSYTNIALDEMFFVRESFEPVIRCYTWQYPAWTIGYFQKYSDIKNENNYPIIRRLTGGLAVLHKNDLSYSVIIDDTWPYLYNQEKTYEAIHNEIKKSLFAVNIICDGNVKFNTGHKDISCVKTFYKDDLFVNGKKVVGSCQRRRGKKILVEGSIHLKLNYEQIKNFANIYFNNISKFLNCKFEINSLTDNELIAAKTLVEQKYNTDKWKGLF